jgi:hypothetical protein
MGPLRGDIGFCWGDWKPRTWRDVNSVSVSCGDNPLMASQNRCARAIRSVFGAGRAGQDCRGDMIGVRGGVASPWVVTEGADTDTVAMTWFKSTPLHRL